MTDSVLLILYCGRQIFRVMGYFLRKEDRELLHAVHGFILDNTGLRLTVDVLCRKAAVNKVKFTRGFTELFGLTPAAFILEQRMLGARQLLTETEKPIKEIAGLVGYSNVKSFHRVFHHYFQLTPSSLRKGKLTKCNL